MGFSIFVNNLSFQMEDEDLKEVFEKFGEVLKAVVIRDRLTQRSRGFGFVTMKDEEEGKKAIAQLNGIVVQGRVIMCDIARPKREKEY